jgi:stage II sporulation SpoE-like protein
MTCMLQTNDTSSLVDLRDYTAHLLQVPANVDRSRSFSRPHNPAGIWVSAVILEETSVRLVQADLKGTAEGAWVYHDYLRDQLSRAPARSPVDWLHDVSRGWPGDRTAGLAIVDLDLARHCYRVVLADHPAPLVCQGGTAVRLPIDRQFGLIGTVENRDATEFPWLPFAPGSLLVLPTSGVLDAGISRGDRFGMHRLKRAVEAAHGPRQVLKCVCRDVFRHLDGHPLEDDLTLLLIARGRVQAAALAQEYRATA